MPTDWKPPARIVNPNAGRRKVQQEGRCRACRRVPSGHLLDSLNRCHLVPKGQRGDDVDENIVPLCGSGTSGCHGKLTTHSPGWELVAARLRRRLAKEERDYVLRTKGLQWLNRVYPAESLI